MKRQEIERQIVKRAIKTLLDAGYSLGVNDGEETVIEHSTDGEAVFKEMFATDEDYLLVYNDAQHKHFAYVWFIYGNSGWDVISDYTTNISEAMDKVLDYAQTFEG